MPKKIDYPRGSLKGALEIASTVRELGGSCDKSVCAEKLSKSVTSGAFIDRIAASGKYGLVNNRRGILTVTQLYKDYYLSYDDVEKSRILKKIFLNVPVFNAIYNKYRGEKLPVDILEKALIKEFDIDEKMANRVKGYFISGAKMAGFLNADGTFNQYSDKVERAGDLDNTITESSSEEIERSHVSKTVPRGNNYIINITGPAINQTIEIIEEDHLDIVEAVLGMIKKKMSVKKDET